MVRNFIFLGLLLRENMSREPHIDLLTKQFTKYVGLLNKLKHALPIHI